ncbi:substrate-binding domain-containing protein [Pigmentiphaga sp. NML080357]|uniref:sugar ABC transporter substrate-binding protein n=1 Tax=Pigmentiphaga sp. NML080357 TaxID=2008675 RepID=UPI001303378C|nr:substrate-binding domain-containing protein [Pigmentiphaga sp. NML080357]
MRKLAVVSLALALACLSSNLAAQARPVTLGVALASDTNPFYIQVKRGIDAKAKELGWNVSYVSANEVAATQNDGIGDLIAKRVDAIIVSPIDSVAVAPSYDAAARAGIPIVSVVRTVQSPSQRVAVTGNFQKIGLDTGRWMAKAIGGAGKVAMIGGPAGADLFRNFGMGFKAGIREHKGVSVVFEKEGPLTREFGLRMAEDILVAHPDIRGIYCGNDEQALGAAQAVAAVGKQGEIVITGSNAVPAALRAVKAGAIAMTVDLRPFAWGQLGTSTVARLLNGESLPAVVDIDYALIDKTTVDQALQGPK